MIDVLEQREMLSAPPTILQAGVLPVTGSNTSATPPLQIEFSDSMVGSSSPATGALSPSNYVLLGSTGILVPITSVSFVAGTPLTDQEVSLTYTSGNAGNVLAVDTYTLYVRGNDLTSATSGLAMSQPGQLFAANSGRNNLAVVNIPGTSGLGTTANYSVPFTSPAAALPNAVAFGDVNGDGIPDLIVVDQGTNAVEIFAGQAASVGGGFNSAPTFTLALPAVTTAATTESIALGDFNGATFPTGAPELDIAVASANSDTVSVFLNISTSVGITNFGAGTTYVVDPDPVGITVGNFDNNAGGNLSLAVAASKVSGINYLADILQGHGDGTFAAVQQIVVGTSAPTGVTTPTSIASGVFQSGALPTLVVGGANGVEVLKNISTPGLFAFALQPLLAGSTATTELAVGNLSSGGALSIAATTAVNTLQVYENNGSGAFLPVVTTPVISNGAIGQIAIGDVNNDGVGDIVVPNGNASGGVTVLTNTTVGGTITAASRTAGNPIVITAPGNNLVTGQSVTISGNSFPAGAANVASNPITIVNDTISSISASAGTVTVTTSTSVYGLAVGDMVTIAGTGVGDGTFAVATVVGLTFTYLDANASGNASIGTWTDAAKFILNGTSGPLGGAGTGGTWALIGAIASASRILNNPIVITSPGNGLDTGDWVNVAGNVFVPAGPYQVTILNGGITAANTTGTGTVTITATTVNGLALAGGDTVTIAGSSLAVADGTWVITNVAGNTFTFANAAATVVGNGTGGTWINSASAAIASAATTGAGTVTITASTNGLALGETVTVTGSSLLVANGIWTLTGVTPTTFTFANAAATVAGNGSGGTWTFSNKFSLNGTAGAAGGPTAGGTWTTTTGFNTGLVIVGSTTGANPAVTLNSTIGLSIGMEVSGVGIAAGTTIASIVSGTSILLSQNATATNAGVNLTFTNFYSTDANPLAIALADTNQDGNLDIVTANAGAGANDVSLVLGNGDGTFQAPANFSAASSSPLQNIVVADLNNDGIPDIIVANNVNGNGNTKITIYQGLGNGQYAAGVTISPGNVQNIVGLAVGHFSNANGSSASFPDIVYADGNGFDNTVGFLQNKLNVVGQTITAASFAAAPTVNSGGNNLTSLAVGDFNNDGLTDVLVGYAGGGGFHGHNPPGVAALINTSTNASNFQFTPTQYDTGAAATISSLAVGDFNNDGNLDFVAAVNNSPGQIILNIGDGKGNFTSTNGTSFFTTIPNPVSITVGDFNNDGFKDVVVASSSTATTNTGVAVLMNQLGTGFGTPIVSAVAPGTALQNVVVGDVNGDGVPDLVVSTAITTGSITGTSAAASSPITIDTNSVNGLAAGMTITISGVLGDTAANGTWTIGTVNGGHAPNFTILGSTANAAYSASPNATWAVGNTQDNVYVMMGNSTGSFSTPIPYLAGPTGTPFLAPTYLAITPSPLQPVTTFTSGGTLIQAQLVNNGNTESRDLSGEQGNLLGWQTYNDPTGAGSVGAWVASTGTTSPLSGTSVPAPTGNYQALLDEPNVVPYTPNGMNNNPNSTSSYAGGHALYQDVTIPANANSANFSMSLYINNTGLNISGVNYSDPIAADANGNPSLNFNTGLANQQVRVDIMTVNLITGATNASAATYPALAVGTIVISSANHGLSNDQQVTITGVQGDSAANGTWFVKVIDPNHFALYADPLFADPILGNGVYSSGGEWTQNFLSVNTAATGGTDQVLQQLFQTYAASDATVPSTPFSTDALTYSGVISASLLAYAGKTVRIRVASANNQGPLLVGVDNVKLNVQFADTTAPTLNNLAVNNPSFFVGLVPYTNDPTITGTIGSPAGLSNAIAYVAFDPTNGNFTSPSVVKTTQWDATGNFSFTLPSATPGLNTIGVEVVDRAGNVVNKTFQFYLLTNSVTQWDPVGPQGIDVSGQGVNYTKISGRITATLTDALDPSGNTYLVASVNGGIWRTTDGGNNWTSVTSNVLNGVTPIAVNVGAMAQAAANPNVMYAATGIADSQLDSLSGVGILQSINDGLTWTLLPGSTAAFTGARITAMVADPNDPTGNIAFAAVASGGAGPGVYRTTDGGLTWTNILAPASNMYTTIGPGFLAGNGPRIGGALGSVTSMVINPFWQFGELVIGIGSIGLGVGASGTGGVWMTTNAFTATAANVSWAQIVGNNHAASLGIAADGLPTGAGVGRVTVALGNGTASNDGYLYVMIAQALPVAPVGNNLVNYGDFSGLYRSTDNGEDFTKVMLNQDTGTGINNTATQYTFTPINLLGGDGANVGSLVISPTDPKVVYVGGSSYWDQAGIPNHALLYVDTGNMISGTMDLGLNNGDDQTKYNKGLAQVFYNPAPGLANDPYTGEGVYWYDMIEGQSGTTPNRPLKLLPAEITTLSFDSQGRLLIGTVGGIWRGINNGFSYDFTSGGTGILAQGGGHGHGPAPFATAGMSFTSINGNLQISDMTSVAIDPVLNSNTYYTTQVDTGVATNSPANGWVSDGLTGPGIFNIPTAVKILTASTTTGSVDLYRIWEYANTGALLPQVSTDGGATWQSLAGVPAGINAGLIPALAINPTALYSNSLAFGQLLFGSSPVVASADSGNTWAPEGQPAGVAPGAFPTAAAIAPTNDQVYYIGDDHGEVWATTSGGGGAGSWSLAAGAASGLPVVSANSPIKAITVDPTNPAKLFVMFGGTTSTGIQVYESVNGTSAAPTFTPVPGPWGSAQAYAMVIDPTAALGAANGKIYLATQVGVYVSIDGGTTWNALGQGMPNVPVVDLAYNTNQQVLAAATLGRGVLTINTSAISVVPAQTVNENTTFAPSTSAVIPLTVNDVGNVSYTITATSSDPNLIASGAISITPGAGSSFSSGSFTGSNLNLQFSPVLNAYNTPVNGQGGAGVGDWQGPNSGATAETITLHLTSGLFTSTQTFNVGVNFVNYPPTVSIPGSQTVLTNTSSLPIAITVGDVETPAGALVLQASSNTPALIPTANLVLGGSAPITAATWNAGTVTVAAANTFTAGQQVVIAGMTPAGYDGAFTILAANSTSFTYALAVNPGQPGGTTPITVATWAGNIATITAANTFTLGQHVIISGMTPAGYNNGGVPVTIASASSTGFTYALSPTPGGAATGFGTATLTGAPIGTATTANRTLVITPLAGQIGSAIITLTVSDSNGGQTQQTFNVLVTAPATLPFSDNFNSPATSVFTGPYWTTDAGTTPRVNGKIVSTTTATADDATLSGLAQSNIALQADIVVGSASGQYAGLVARYGGVVPITAAAYNAVTGMATITAANTFTAGQTVVVSGMTPLAYDGTFTIASASSTSFSYALATNPGGVGTAPFGTATVDTGDTNMYWGAIYSIGTSYVAIIEKVVNGALTTLSQAAVPAALGGTGTLFFDVTGSSLKLFYGPTGTANPTLLTYAFDNSYTTGGAGFRISGSATGATTLDNFAAAAIAAPASQLLPVSDNFGVAGNFNQLSPQWVEASGAFQDNTTLNTAVAQSSATANVATIAGVNDANVSVQANVTLAVGQYAGVVARYEGPTAAGQMANSNYYTALLVQSSATQAVVYIFRNYQGGLAQIGTSTTILNAQNTSTPIIFQVVGNSLKAYVNGNLEAYADDPYVTNGLSSLVPGGSVGIFASGGASISSFSASDLTPTPVLPVVPAFPTVTTPNLTSESPAQTALGLTPSQLDNTVWVEQAGNFTTSGAGATGNTATNIATLYGANNANVSVQANVTLAAAGQYAGLLARYEGPTVFGQVANANYYTALLDQTSATQAVVLLFRNYQGGLVQIGTSSPAFANTPGVAATLQLQVEGNSLKAFVNGALKAYAQDPYVTNGPSSLVPGGSVGIYASAGALINAFQASDITPTPVPFPVNDSFGSPSPSSQLNTATWVEQAGNFTDNGANATGATATNIATVYGVNDANVSVQANFTLQAGQLAGVVARYEGPTTFGQSANANYYTALLVQSSATQAIVYIARNYQGGLSVISSSPSFAYASGTPTTLTFQVVGNSLKAYVNGALETYIDDPFVTNGPSSLVPGGSVGIYSSAGVAFTNFTANDITPAAQVVTSSPATFNLTTESPAQSALGLTPAQLDNTVWVEQAGNFTTSGAGATGNTATNIATLYGANNANVSVQASVTLNAAGQYAGLVARYEGPTVFGQGANANYYTALLDQTSATQAIVLLFRNYQGGLVQIGTSTAAFANTPGVAATLTLQVEGNSLKAYVNGVLKAFAQDPFVTNGPSSLVPGGSVGIYTSAGASINNFTASDITPPVPVVPLAPGAFTDTFNTPSQTNQLNNTTWVEQAGNFTDNGVIATGTAATNVATLYGVNKADVSVQANVTLAAGQYAGVVARYDGPTVFGQGANANYYTALLSQTSASQATVYIARVNSAGGLVIIASASIANPAGTSTLTFQVEGTSLKVFVGASLKVYAEDSTLSSGSVGIYAIAATSFTSFSASAIGVNQSAGFADPLNSSPFANQLDSAKWTEQAGNFTETGSGAAGQASANLATVYGLSYANQTLQANIALTTIANQTAGLVARYSGQFDANYYYATVTSTTTANVVLVRLWKNINGMLTQLGSTITVNNFGGLLKFTVIGSTLTLTTDVTLQLQLTDVSIANAGSAGIRTGAGSSMTNFSAN